MSIEFSIKTIHAEKHRSQCMVAAVFENRQLGPTLQDLDQHSKHFFSTLLRKGDLDGILGQWLLLQAVPHLNYERVLCLGAGPDAVIQDHQYREIIKKMMACLMQTNASEATVSLLELPVKDRDIRWKARMAVQTIYEALYAFVDFKSKASIKRNLRQITFTVPSRKEMASCERGVIEGQAISEGMNLIKDLGNTPPNVCTPSYLADEARKLSKQYKSISVAVLDEKEAKALKMGSFLSVAQGSIHPPKFITLEYRGRKDKQKPYVFVGKAITFDTGGNSIKIPPNMIGMKYDMSGGATVLALLKTAAALELPLNIVGVIPAAENMPGAKATRPEDIVTSMSGLTIEILNTDAEGRLILADALTYCERFDPEVVIDVATLTGAALAALGRYPSALMSNYQPLADDLLKAGNVSGDRCWQLPLWEDYQETLASNFADVANVGSAPEGGAIIAACFLARFAKKFHWAHLDVAGTAARYSGKERGATGRPLPLLIQYLLDRS